jgi:hypothetical protein
MMHQRHIYFMSCRHVNIFHFFENTSTHNQKEANCGYQGILSVGIPWISQLAQKECLICKHFSRWQHFIWEKACGFFSKRRKISGNKTHLLTTGIDTAIKSMMSSNGEMYF